MCWGSPGAGKLHAGKYEELTSLRQRGGGGWQSASLRLTHSARDSSAESQSENPLRRLIQRHGLGRKSSVRVVSSTFPRLRFGLR